MATVSYDASKRGKLVNPYIDIFARIYTAPRIDAATPETVGTTIGTASGKIYQSGQTTFIEVIRPAKNPFIVTVEFVYVKASEVGLEDNPIYDGKKDTSVPKATDKPSNDDDSDLDVSTRPGPGRIPVVASDGKTVYVLVGEVVPTTDTSTSSENVTQNSTLIYAVYGVIVVGLIALIIALARSPQTPT